MNIPEVIIYKYFTKEDILKLVELMMSDSGDTKLSDGTCCSKLNDGKIELELIEENYEHNP